MSLIYDICLVRDRLRWIIADLSQEDTLFVNENTIDALQRVNAFLAKKLHERGIYDGQVPEDFPQVRHEVPSEEASVGEEL